jgi:hypothetical protein
VEVKVKVKVTVKANSPNISRLHLKMQNFETYYQFSNLVYYKILRVFKIDVLGFGNMQKFDI